MMRQNAIRRSLVHGTSVFLVLTLIAACSSKRDDFHQDSAQSKSLEVPPDLIAPDEKSDFELPELAQRQQGEFELDTEKVERSAPASVASSAIRLHHRGSLYWLEINQPVDALWPRVRAFWQDQGFTLAWQDEDLAMLETQWSEVPLSGQGLEGQKPILRERFRTRLEAGSAHGATEVYVIGRQLQGQQRDGVVSWELLAGDHEAEIAMVKRMMVWLGAELSEAKKMRSAQVSKQGQEIIVEDELSQVWRRVGVAIDRADLSLSERDVANSSYFVRVHESGRNGISDEPTAVNPLIYRIRLHERQQTVRVEIEPPEGESSDSARLERVRETLYEQLK